MIQLDVLCIGWLARDGDGNVTEAHSTSTLIRAGDRNIVVDVSTPYMWPAVKTSFRQIGIFPEDVDTVVLTHTHGDHSGNLRRYRDARVLVHSGGDPVEGAEVIDTEDHEVCPGVRIVHVPGHCPEECAVFVEADRRYVCAGDAVPLEDNIVEDKIPAIHTDAEAAAESMRRIRGFADVIIPGHGPPFVIRSGPHLGEQSGRVRPPHQHVRPIRTAPYPHARASSRLSKPEAENRTGFAFLSSDLARPSRVTRSESLIGRLRNLHTPNTVPLLPPSLTSATRSMSTPHHRPIASHLQ